MQSKIRRKSIIKSHLNDQEKFDFLNQEIKVLDYQIKLHQLQFERLRNIVVATIHKWVNQEYMKEMMEELHHIIESSNPMVHNSIER